MTDLATADATVDGLCGDLARIRAPRGRALSALSRQTEAPLRILLNNLDFGADAVPPEFADAGIRRYFTLLPGDLNVV